jgi:hypothetical protein
MSHLRRWQPHRIRLCHLPSATCHLSRVKSQPLIRACARALPCLLGCVLSAAATSSSAQERPGPTLGIRGIGAIGIHAGYSRVDRGADAAEASATLDLGHFSSPRVRLAAEAAFLRAFPHREFVIAEDTTYRDVFYDLSGHVNLQLLMRDPARAAVPYLSFGLGVHALTSSFGSIPIDLRYNTNVFGLKAATGLRLRLPGGRHAIVAEGAAVLSKAVSRSSIRLGTEWLFADLRRR